MPTWKVRCKSVQVSETFWPRVRRRVRRDADRADVYDDESEDASKREQVTLVLVSKRALSCKRGKAWPSKRSARNVDAKYVL